jgi:hypothetical protein
MALTVPSAFASAGTWTVTPSNTAWTATLAGNSSVSGDPVEFVLTDTTAGVSITCTVGSASGTTGSSPNTTGLLATITSSSFGSTTIRCTDILGDPWTVTQVPGTMWDLNALSYDSATGVTTIDITNISALVSGSINGTACSFDITGTANGTYTNPGTQTSPGGLQVTGASLTISNTTAGCSSSVNGLITIGDGDSATFTVGCAITNPIDGITMTDP